MGNSEMKKLYYNCLEEYNKIVDSKVKFDISRGKPNSDQLKLSMGLHSGIDEAIFLQKASDYRNYGIVDGIPEAKQLFSEIMGVSSDEIIVANNASLNLMYDMLTRALLFGVPGINKPWCKEEKIKFLCPSPGYDRHFAICEQLGIEMITVDLKEDGPDMDLVEKLVASDESIKGIWCVPLYSNPTGTAYADEVVDRLASMETKAQDFRIFWDNAYLVHHLYDEHDSVKNLLEACKKFGTEDRVFMFMSTSKISFPGAGVAAVAASKNNITEIKKQMSVQTIGPDKINQLRHVLFFKSVDGIKEHMKKHADIIRPKFELMLSSLENYLGAYNFATWTKPKGGYFISLNTLDGCASAVVNRAMKAGLVLTPAGSTYPYHKDPNDSNIRIAPTYVSLEELKVAAKILCLSILLVSIEKMLPGEL